MRVYRFASLACMACGLLALIGCGPSETQTVSEDSHIKSITVMYGQYLAANKGRPPVDEKAFKSFLEQTIKSRQMQTTVSEWMKSPRDNEEYGVRYGTLGNSDKGVFIYEKKGKNGKRFVGFATGAVEEVDEARFKELVPST